MCKGGTRNSVCPSAKAQWLSRHKGPSSLWPDLVGRRRSVRQRPAPKRKATAKAKSKTLQKQGKKKRDCAFADGSHDEQPQGPQVKLLRGQRRVPLGFYPCSVKCVQNNGDEADTFTVHTHTHTGEIDSEKSIRLFWHLFTPVRNAVELLGPLSAKKFQSTNFLWS